MGNEGYTSPRLCDEMLDQWPIPKLERYVVNKSLDIGKHKDHGRQDDAARDQQFLDQALAALTHRLQAQDQVA